MRKFFKIMLCLQLLLSGNAFAQTFQATVNRTEVPQGETFLLTLETDDDKTNATPDLSGLEKDFNVYSVGNAFQSTYINGVSSHSRQWQIVLMPKNAGKIEIPAIKLGKLTSNPIQLNVVSSNVAQQTNSETSAESPKFAVDATVDNKNPYVQQQINYTFKIYDSGGLHGEAPVIMDEGNNDWIVKSLGEPSINSKVINGRQLREIEFKYALFPQKSGTLKTPQFVFNGYYLTRHRHDSDAFEDIFNNGFFNMGFSDMFASRHPVVLQAEQIAVDVKSVPAANGGYWWLPASQVVLSAEWDEKNPVFHAGEAVSRSVYLKAAGVIENQLPDIKFEDIPNVKQYPDKPVVMSSQSGNQIISIKKFGNVFIPEKTGEITIPPVSIDWYNIQSGQLEKAILPAQKVVVLPGKGEILAQEQMQTNEPQSAAIKEQDKPVSKLKDSHSSLSNILWIIIAFGLGGLLSYIFFAQKNQNNLSAKAYAKLVEKDIVSGDLKKARDDLIEWAKLAYEEPRLKNLEDISEYASEAYFKAQLEEIGKALYAPKKSKFQAETFLKTFKEEQKQHKKKKKEEVILPKLYK